MSRESWVVREGQAKCTLRVAAFLSPLNTLHPLSGTAFGGIVEGAGR